MIRNLLIQCETLNITSVQKCYTTIQIRDSAISFHHKKSEWFTNWLLLVKLHLLQLLIWILFQIFRIHNSIQRQQQRHKNRCIIASLVNLDRQFRKHFIYVHTFHESVICNYLSSSVLHSSHKLSMPVLMKMDR